MLKHLELYKSLEKGKVKYLVVGGVASILYGMPRATFDLDLFVENSYQNVDNLLKSFEEIGMGTVSLTTVNNVCKTEITIFEDIIRVDVLTKLRGINFQEAWKTRNIQVIQNIPVNLISEKLLLKSKLAANRDKDQKDIAFLKKILKEDIKK